MLITLTKCPRCGACPAEHRCECPVSMTPEQRADEILRGESKGPELHNAIVAAITEATGEQRAVNGGKTPNELSEAVMEHVEAIRALIYQKPPLFVCFWCGNETSTRHEVRGHALVCPENPVTVRLAARERDIERAVKAIGRAEACWSDANSAAHLRTARQALQRLPEVPDEKV